MDHFKKEERAFAVECYFHCGESVKCLERKFRKRFAIPPRGRIPRRAIIRYMVMKSYTKRNVHFCATDKARHRFSHRFLTDFIDYSKNQKVVKTQFFQIEHDGINFIIFEFYIKIQ